MNNNEIIKSLENADFAQETCKQIIKEFEKVGVALSLDINEKDTAIISKKIAEELDAIIGNAPHLLAQLFYSIDLPEEKVKAAMEKNDFIEEGIANAILIRSAQKVYIRKRYSTL